jgi:dihydrofolate synthase/folylpolyglutamate synthase
MATALALRLCGVSSPEQARSLEPALRSGLGAARWPARLERVADDPPTYLDAAHTPDAARRLAESLPGLLNGRPLVLVAACSADKDAEGVLSPLVGLAEVVITTRSVRGLEAEVLRGIVVRLGCREVRAVEPVDAALAAAQEVARARGGVVVLAGSLFAAAEGLNRFVVETTERELG